jgi:integrase
MTGSDAFYSFWLGAGLRVGEMTQIQAKNTDFQKGYLHIQAAKSKGKKPRLATKAHEEAGKLKTQAEALKTEARLEDLTVRVAEKVKTTKKGSKTYTYWVGSWREMGKVRNIHLGSTRKLSRQAARQKARAIKAEALGV